MSMASGRLSTVRQVLHSILGAGGVADRPDGRLLDDYLARHNEAAFAALVERYGPLVLGVCRRVLQDQHDAEDAFQATFLVLARKAASLDRQRSLGNWLYAVAYRTALKAKINGARRRVHERQVVDMPALPSPESSRWEELRPVLDEELSRLPEKYRAPLVLCYLEGKTHLQAARDLGWPSGSVSRRMARARELLRERLLRRGVIISSAVLLTLLPKMAARASVPPGLAASTVKGALVFGKGTMGTAGIIPSKVTMLANEILHSRLVAGAAAGALALPVTGLAILVTSTLSIVAHEVVTEYRKHTPPVAVRSGGCPGCRDVSGALVRGEIALAPQADPVLALAMTQEGKVLASGSAREDTPVQLWDMITGSELARLGGRCGAIRALAFSPDGLTLASGGADRTVRLWDISSRVERLCLTGHAGEVLAVAFAPGGDLLATGATDHTVRLWDPSSGQAVAVLRGHRGPVAALAYSPDGSWLVSGGHDGATILWDSHTGHELGRCAGTGSPVTAVGLSPNGKLLATGGEDMTVTLWDVATRRARATLAGHTAAVRGVAFNFDGTLLLSAGSDGTLRVWHVAAPRSMAVVQGHADAINAVVCARYDPRVATAGSDRNIRVWRVEETLARRR
jgi:RNA polymerase sigma factor (sigma-70 family)